MVDLDNEQSEEKPEVSDSVLGKIMQESESKEINAVDPFKSVSNALNKLRERERDILVARYGLNFGNANHETLESIGQKLSVTRERIRQIEKAALRKMGKKFATNLRPLWKIVDNYMNLFGGVGSLEGVADYLKIDEGDNIELEKNALRLALATNSNLESLKKQLSFKEGWMTKGTVVDKLTKIQEATTQILEKNGKPMSEGQLIEAINKTVSTNDTLIKGVLLISPQFGLDAKNFWGLAIWSTIVPKRIRDKVLIVLDEAGKPLHFNDITKLVAERFKNDKKVLSRTVHNELIGDDRFVLVGRGIYALKSWGYSTGVVSDVIREVLARAGTSLHVSEIIKLVLKSRQVKRNTIVANLQNKSLFKKVAKATYALADSSASAQN